MTSPTPVIPLTQPVTAPRRFGKYILIRKLAEGGMAEIYLAKQVGAEGFERDVVIKCMLDHFCRSPEFVSMFLDEARLAARLHHPNIVQITDLGTAENRYFICMEYLAGEDLDAVIAAAHYKGQLTPISIAARIMLSALEGLEFAHKYEEEGRPAELVHRDISPSNIFVTFQGTVKVLDFGIAKASSRVTQTQPGLLKGKWGYMSPEQARGEASLDARSDLFSLGVTFHELLTARRVFERDTEIGVLLALMDQPIPPPSSLRPEIPPAIDQIVMRALQRRREDRYASAAEMRAELEEFLRGTPSIPSVTQLAQYMQDLFGQAEVVQKTKIPSLTQLGALSLLKEDSVGYEKTLIRQSDPNGIPALPAQPLPAVNPYGTGVTSQVVQAPAPAPLPPARNSGLSMALGALAAVALLALGGGAAAFYFMSRPAPPAPVVVTTPPVVQPTPPVEPTPAPTPTPPVATPTPTPTEPVVQKPETPPETPPVEPTTKPTVSVKPSVLTTREFGLVMKKNSGKILACGEKFRSALPPERRVILLVTIAHSGEVRSTKVTEPATVSPELATCLETQMKRVAFPRNTNQPELQIQLPLRFNEQ